MARREAKLRREHGEAAATSDNVTLAFAELCRQLERPFPIAEIRAAAPATDHKMVVGNVLLAAERLGFKARQVKPRPRALAQIPTPFLLIGRRPGEGWLVRARVRDHLVLVDPASGRESVTSLEGVADLA
jgi:ABC-type bacteriocin/lantibiotic exporter with double-glycine peptidase domain